MNPVAPVMRAEVRGTTRDMSANPRHQSLVRLALAGAASGVAWRAVEPALRRLFGHPYSDPELVTAFVTRGRWQPPLDYAVQAAGGAGFATAVAKLGGRSAPLLFAALLAENVALLAASPIVDRVHPDVRDGTWPPLTGNPRAAAVSLSGHLLYGALMAAWLARSG
jgi:hypothetical protein